MQINHLKHLMFPEAVQPAPPGKTGEGNATGAGLSGTSAGAAAPTRRGAVKDQGEAPPAPRAASQPGVIVSIRGDGSGNPITGASADLVYTGKRNAPAADEALTPKFVGTKSEEFVNFAVQTMRQFAEEQERAKALAKPAAGDEAHLIPRNLGDVQKLAARFKLFA